MSEFLILENKVLVSPQINAADIDTAATQGITLIINNRPDGEEVGQPTNDSLQKIAEAKGIKWLWIPVVGGQITPEDIENSIAAFKEADGKTLAYCRTGTRSSMMWSFYQAATDNLSTADILTNTSKAGYDFAQFTGMFEQLRGTAK